MAEKEGDANNKADNVSRLQAKLDDLGVMFYAYLGMIQHDAPPSERPPDEAEEKGNDEKARAELSEKIPGFAKSIVQTSVEIEKIINDIEVQMKLFAGKERDILEAADFESRQAGDEMTEAADDANKLLASIRQVIAVRDNEA